MWFSLASLSTISPVIPLMQNMPIWLVTWVHCLVGRAHVDDAAGRALHLLVPQQLQLGIAEDRAHLKSQKYIWVL
jgi:hypothetical protein